MQSGDRDAVEGGTNAFSCPDPKATPARAKHQALQAWVCSLRVPTPVSPSPGNVPPPQLCPLPSSVSSASSLQRRGGRHPDPGAPLSSPPCRRSWGHVTSARRPSTMLGRPRCGSPHLRPGRGQEARHSLPPAQPQPLRAAPPPAPAPRSPPASSPGWGGLSPPPSTQVGDTGSGIRAAGEGSRQCANISAQHLWLGPATFWGEQKRAAPVQPPFDPSQPLARAPSPHWGSPAPDG